MKKETLVSKLELFNDLKKYLNHKKTSNSNIELEERNGMSVSIGSKKEYNKYKKYHKKK